MDSDDDYLSDSAEEEDTVVRPAVVTNLWNVISQATISGTFACGEKLPFIIPEKITKIISSFHTMRMQYTEISLSRKNEFEFFAKQNAFLLLLTDLRCEGLCVDGYGEVSFPFKESEAKQLIPHCESTSADIGDAHMWQLKAPMFQLMNSDFNEQINSLVVKIAEELGASPSTNVTAQLSTLLIHEAGGFFVRQGIDDNQRVFASLVVTLPSIRTGGELVVVHQGLVKTFKSETPGYSSSYTAFFNSCDVGLQPVTSGYCLSLVYNLVSLGSDPLPQPSSNELIFKAKECIHNWSDDDTTDKAVYVLYHKYTPEAISKRAFKGSDKARLHLLHEAVQNSKFMLLVAQIEYTKEGEIYNDWGSKKVSKYSKSFEINSLMTEDGVVDISIRLNNSDNCTPDSQHSSEWSRMHVITYKRAAIVVLLRDKFIDFIAKGHYTGVIKYLDYLVAKCSKMAYREDVAEWSQCIKLVTLLLENNQVALSPSLSHAIVLIGKIELVQGYFAKLQLSHNQFGDLCSMLDSCWAKFGWESISDAMIMLSQNLTVEKSIKLLDHLISLQHDDLKAQETMKLMAHDLIKSKAPTEYRLSKETIGDLARVTNSIDPTLLADIFKYLYSRYNNVDSEFVPILRLFQQQVPTIVKRPEFINITTQCIAFLRNRVTAALARADDWSVSGSVNCNCGPCTQVNYFLRSPKLLEHKYKAAERQRNHVSQMIYATKLPNHGILVVTTDASSHSLVITKTAKELDVAKQTAMQDETTIAELTAFIAIDDSEQERAAKRQKLDDKS